MLPSLSPFQVPRANMLPKEAALENTEVGCGGVFEPPPPASLLAFRGLLHPKNFICPHPPRLRGGGRGVLCLKELPAENEDDAALFITSSPSSTEEKK